LVYTPIYNRYTNQNNQNNPIVNAVRSQFNWMEYRLLIQIYDSDKREESLHYAWTGHGRDARSVRLYRAK